MFWGGERSQIDEGHKGSFRDGDNFLLIYKCIFSMAYRHESLWFVHHSTCYTSVKMRSCFLFSLNYRSMDSYKLNALIRYIESMIA